jgi:hypothetical protein
MNAGRRTVPWWIARFFGPCLLAAIALLLPSDRAGATSFSPSWDITVTDPTPGATSPLVFDLNLPAPGAQFQSLVAFIPPEFTIADGRSIPNGAVSGRVNAVARMGLINGACESTIVVGFELLSASVNPELTINLNEGIYDHDGDTLPENVEYYPNTLAVLAPDMIPLQRLYGQIPVAGTLVPLNIVIFPPAAPLPLFPEFDPSLGYPAVTMLGDPFAVPYPGDPVSDFCTPLTATTTLEGVTKNNPATPPNEAGVLLRTNPSQPGSFNSILFARSRWDADNDGIENNLDPCPLTDDTAWDPRSSEQTTGDTDEDGLPDSCDTNDTEYATDHDGDGMSNRLDPCPLLATSYRHGDEDRDGIGNDCDPFPDDQTNAGAAHRHEVCVNDVFSIGNGGPVPPWECPSGPDLPVPPRLRLQPVDGVEATGLVQSMYVIAYRSGGTETAAAATVSFVVTGANNASGSCLTGNVGNCEFNYQGLNNGRDTIVATATIDGFMVTDTSSILWVSTPVNDNFGSSMPVGALPFEDTQLPIAATEQPSEPRPCGGELRYSIWYSFTPDKDVLITAEVETNAGPMLLAAYTGSVLSGLTLIQCDSTYPDFFPIDNIAQSEPENDYAFEEYVAFKATAGVTYHFQVASQFGLYGDPELTFSIHESMMGDVNCSDTLDSVDALGILRTSAGLSKPPCAGNGDVNCNDVINAADALVVLRASAGLIPRPVSCPG